MQNPTVNEIFEYLNTLAPVGTKMDFDNVGLLVGRGGTPVRRVLVALDITQEVIEEAAETGAQLIVSHHPLFFGLKSVTDGDAVGRKILRLADAGISAICMHTNLDAAAGGVNDALARALDLRNTKPLAEDGIGRVGELDREMALPEFLSYVKTQLRCTGVRCCDAGRPVRRLSVVGGSGGDYLAQALIAGSDTFLTADVKYHMFLEAKEAGLNLIDAGHFSTENVICPEIRDLLGKAFPGIDVCVSDTHADTIIFC